MFDPLKNIKLGEGRMFTDEGMTRCIGKVHAQLVDMTDDVIVKTVIEAAKEAGITDLYLLDKTFVVDVLKRAAAHGHWEDDGYAWKCNLCHRWLMIEQGDADMNFCPHCGTRMDGEDHGKS